MTCMAQYICLNNLTQQSKERYPELKFTHQRFKGIKEAALPNQLNSKLI